MKTVLQILPSLRKINGGVERGTLDIARELAEKKFKSVIISSGGEMAEKYKYKGVPFSAWLYRIASNEVNQFFRRNQKNRVVSLEDQNVHQLKEEFELEDKKALEFNLNVLQEVIQLLKPAEVELLELRFFEQRPFKEIGEILDMTENNAKVKVYRLLQKMKKLFQKNL